mgnify:CR=1 FL=1
MKEEFFVHEFVPTVTVKRGCRIKQNIYKIFVSFFLSATAPFLNPIIL